MAVYDPTASTAPAVPAGPPVDVRAPGASDKAVVTAELRYYVAALVLVVVGVLGGWGLMQAFHPDAGALPQLAPGVGVFAVLYVLAQAIERLIEPFSPILGGVLGVYASGRKRKGELVVARNIALVEVKQSGDEQKKRDCMDAQDALNQFRANASPMAFGIAALLAMLSAGYTGFLVLHVIGLAGVAPWVDVLITGLAVGGGIKPLHDLITNLRESKTSKQDPQELQTN
jgi:hypothetical protein